MKYKVKGNIIFKHLSFTIFLIFVLIFAFIYDAFISDLMGGLDIYIIFISIQVLIVLLLLLDYKVNSTRGEVIIKDDVIKTNDFFINKEDVLSIEIYGAPSVYRKSSFKLLPFECFHYVKIVSNKKAIYISSLSDFNLYQNILKEKIFKGKIICNKKGLSNRGSLLIVFGSTL